MKKRSGFKGWDRKISRGIGQTKITFTDSDLGRGVETGILQYCHEIQSRIHSYDLINHSLHWSNTRQGHVYWRLRAHGVEPMTDYDWEFLTQALDRMTEIQEEW